MKVSLKFPDIPAKGTRFSIGEQEYVFAFAEAGKRADGSAITFLVWETNCAECGADFDIKTPLGFTTAQSRRCQLHKAPGKPVNDRTRNFARKGARS